MQEDNWATATRSNHRHGLLTGSVAEWSKALDLGSSLCGGVGANPTTAIVSAVFSECVILFVCVLHMCQPGWVKCRV